MTTRIITILMLIGIVLGAAHADTGPGVTNTQPFSISKLTFSGNSRYTLDSRAVAKPGNQVWSPSYKTSALFIAPRAPVLNVELTTTCQLAVALEMTIEGLTADKSVFSQTFTFPANRDTCSVTNLHANGKFGDYYDCIETIAWSLQAGPDRILLGETDNNIYCLPAKARVREHKDTVLHVVCRCMKGLPYAHRNALGNVWRKFSSLKIDCADRKSLLHYWRLDADINRSTTTDLLKYRSGNCRAWAEFFRDCLLLAGHKGVRIRRLVAKDARWHSVGDYSLKMKHLVFLSKGQDYGHSPYNFKYGADWKFDWRMDATTPAINAQGENVKRGFTMHYLTRIDDKYYDPSYGLTADSLVALEDRILGGIEKHFGADGYLLRPNTAAAELKETRP